MLPLVHAQEELEDLVCRYGFLPFFSSPVKGFSVYECMPPSLWFVDGMDGPWEWKGPIARGKRCAYSKLFGGKAGFVSLEWLPHLANYRRDGYDFDARFEDGLASWRDKKIVDALAAAGGVMLSRELKEACGKPKVFDTSITRLQMQTYVTAADFTYMKDTNGSPYGWASPCLPRRSSISARRPSPSSTKRRRRNRGGAS